MLDAFPALHYADELRRANAKERPMNNNFERPLLPRNMRTRVSHWLPIVTRCPLARLPDFVYVYVYFTGAFAEMKEVRQKVRKEISWRKGFMETLAIRLLEKFPTAEAVEVRLLFGRHKVLARRSKK